MTGPDVIRRALRVRGLGAHAGGAVLLSGVDVDLDPGRVLAVLGPSGAGKSTLGLGLLGEAADGVTTTGAVEAGGPVGYLPQHPGTVLDPLRRVGPVLDELAATVHGADRVARRAAVTAALAAAQIRDPSLARRHPHQLSGGQQQRMALALTLVTRPAVVVLDEPTTALDPQTTTALADDLARLAATGVALVLLTHDRDLARALADEVIVLRDGHVDRRGPTATVLGGEPGDVVAATPSWGAPQRLCARDLTVVAGGRAILDGVSVDAEAGAALGVVGRSGAGKTTLARALAGLVTPRHGRVEVDGRLLRPAALDRDAGSRRAVQYVHQDPRASFLRRRPVLDQVGRPGVLLRGLAPATARAEALTLLAELGVDDATAARRPAALSGGQLQRAAVVRALLARPAVLVADEITAALDAEHRTRLVALLDRVRAEHGTTLLVVSHDLDVVRRLCPSTVVIAGGRIVAAGPTEGVLARSGAAAVVE